ncbi:hypothetical protein SDC9_109869 [bioreactor metagenome]|uniref:Uncharacterized protein n=1 Tax=bioreactor metagenome TaxID=1076179 RepID=A0A645BEA8_9ZZZZ
MLLLTRKRAFRTPKTRFLQHAKAFSFFRSCDAQNALKRVLPHAEHTSSINRQNAKSGNFLPLFLFPLLFPLIVRLKHGIGIEAKMLHCLASGHQRNRGSAGRNQPLSGEIEILNAFGLDGILHRPLPFFHD